ncbi:H-type small acid-soluble spore protein [Cohnella faecalis]|uniref:Small, acid-soluble spore protein, H family n=1 Tax=Cohnella faecalis TaxID=2315694 RepID=A0A398CMZ3_9BACL|nr:H-type small acid-soluble spore protein [Cohnella faecalis]RIE03845.1 small, acid-soluble spore protein, H family [Cohnella faecalis]
MKAERAREIYESESTYPVQLDDGQPVWIENVDVANGVATVQVGAKPTNTQTVAVERLQEGRQQ